MAYLGSLGGCGAVNEPYAINEAGAIAGWSGQANPKAPVHAVMWQGGPNRLRPNGLPPF